MRLWNNLELFANVSYQCDLKGVPNPTAKLRTGSRGPKTYRLRLNLVQGGVWPGSLLHIESTQFVRRLHSPDLRDLADWQA